MGAITAIEPEMIELLSSLVAIPSVSGQERAMTEFVADWARRQGFEVDLWQAEEEELARAFPLPPKFIPLANRPTLVIRHQGRGGEGGGDGARSLMFNAHADVVAAPQAQRWRHGPWSGAVHDGRLHGRGACDDKGPLVSALWAMRNIRRQDIPLAGDLLLELVPGEEDCVGLGTLSSVARGWRSDGLVVLEPTEGRPCCASRGGLRFEVTCLGSAVHGTVKWLGQDAIALVPPVLAALNRLEAKWNDRAADPLFSSYPLMRPVTVDAVHGGQWQGMLCDMCVCGGYLELLPDDDLNDWKLRLAESVRDELKEYADRVKVAILESYDGHRTPTDNPLCRVASWLIASPGIPGGGEGEGLAGFNSGCEAGLRAKLLGTPTLVWGPGSLAQAHAVDEYVELGQVAEVAEQFVGLARCYCNRMTKS
jgi:acetylornithine deacetylase